ncbi:hypothetical protein LIER_15350 [Lithospermum erythrorhizon]|uniref:Uncharacterized protein n=1 Tax=Lithospermum erythrorhizon TaxID=34254 RepID=A0AAV3Q3H0_LITER
MKFQCHRSTAAGIVRGGSITHTSQDEIPHKAWDQRNTGEPGKGNHVLHGFGQANESPGAGGREPPEQGICTMELPEESPK